jgi:cyclopropane-fatty-acyl-phospholipid synthase
MATATVEKRFRRLVDIVDRQYQAIPAGRGSVPFSVKINGGPQHTFGSNEPAFTIILNDERALSVLSTLDQNRIAEAYMTGSIDLDGNLLHALAIRTMFTDKRGFHFLWRFIQPMLFGQVKSDKKWIANHYDTEAEFFELFLDKRHRAYSQAVFAHDDEALEDAETRKLDFALDAVNAKPGDHILDIGSGWGSMVAHAGKKGIRVTSLTISKRSQEYVTKLIRDQDLPCEVLLDHFMEHRPATKYDGIVNCGVTEHLPDYAGSLKQYERLLKPGGSLYLDASAQRVKNGQGTFLARYVFEGNGSLMCLHEYLTAVAKSPFRLAGVWDDRHNYYLTTRIWAERLDSHREEIERRWGRQLYRTFQLYLWGSSEGFYNGMLDAYRVVLRLPEHPPR